jgi:hypothetical protein
VSELHAYQGDTPEREYRALNDGYHKALLKFVPFEIHHIFHRILSIGIRNPGEIPLRRNMVLTFNARIFESRGICISHGTPNYAFREWHKGYTPSLDVDEADIPILYLPTEDYYDSNRVTALTSIPLRRPITTTRYITDAFEADGDDDAVHMSYIKVRHRIIPPLYAQDEPVPSMPITVTLPQELVKAWQENKCLRPVIYTDASIKPGAQQHTHKKLPTTIGLGICFPMDDSISSDARMFTGLHLSGEAPAATSYTAEVLAALVATTLVNSHPKRHLTELVTDSQSMVRRLEQFFAGDDDGIVLDQDHLLSPYGHKRSSVMQDRGIRQVLAGLAHVRMKWQPAHVERRSSNTARWSVDERGNLIADSVADGCLETSSRLAPGNRINLLSLPLQSVIAVNRSVQCHNLMAAEGTLFLGAPRDLLKAVCQVRYERYIRCRPQSRVYGYKNWDDMAWSLAGSALDSALCKATKTSNTRYAFAMKICYDKLPTGAYHSKCNRCDPEDRMTCPYPGCNGAIDTQDHLFFDCMHPALRQSRTQLKATLTALIAKAPFTSLTPKLVGLILRQFEIHGDHRELDARVFGGLFPTQMVGQWRCDYTTTEIRNAVSSYLHPTLPLLRTMWAQYIQLLAPSTPNRPPRQPPPEGHRSRGHINDSRRVLSVQSFMDEHVLSAPRSPPVRSRRTLAIELSPPAFQRPGRSTRKRNRHLVQGCPITQFFTRVHPTQTLRRTTAQIIETGHTLQLPPHPSEGSNPMPLTLHTPQTQLMDIPDNPFDPPVHDECNSPVRTRARVSPPWPPPVSDDSPRGEGAHRIIPQTAQHHIQAAVGLTLPHFERGGDGSVG